MPSSLNGSNRFDDRRKRKARLHPARNKNNGNRRSLVCSPSLAKILAIGAITLTVIWLSFAVLTFYKLSEIQSDQPILADAMQFLNTVKENAIGNNDKIENAIENAIQQSTYKMAPSLAERVPLIDMRQLSATLPFDNPDGGAWKQGWDVKPVVPSKGNPVNIFVVPHSHCDPGWIKTFDDYFRSQTKQILDTIVEALSKDPRRKFIWAEISYFEWWWREQPIHVQELTKKLIANKQLEFVTGGWVQPDEANTQLYAMEVQLQEGHDWLRKTFSEDVIPKYGWSIDPFGYSPTMAYLLKKYNFKGMLIQRVHYAVKKELARRQHLEFNWRQTWDESGEHDIFCHVMPFFSYDVPHTCGPDPSVCCQFDFARLRNKFGGCPWKKPPRLISESNVQARALLLLDQYLKKASLYRSNVVIAPLGDDFRYQTADEAENQFTNYQLIFDYINANVEGVEIQFGTLSDYFEAAMSKFDAPLLKGSFFTYSDVNEDYWSGYFTSRVFDKSLDRALEQTLFAAQSLGASKIDLQEERRALSLFQHHDGITGTAKAHVVTDYAKRIHTSIRTTQDWIGKKMVQMQNLDTKGMLFLPCWRSDDPRGLRKNGCNEETAVHVYNPLKVTQTCGKVEIEGKQIKLAKLPCDIPGAMEDSKSQIQFDGATGMMTHPIREEWASWHDKGGGAYLFVPDWLDLYKPSSDVLIEYGGYSVRSSDERGDWMRQVVERKVPSKFGEATVIDFTYETNLQSDNQEWMVRFTGDITNEGVFHTDLNGFNFDTHYFRKDMPGQSQVFPMPTLASINDGKNRMTILSDHAQGTASLRESTIDVWLDRRLTTDDSRGLGQGVTDNVPTRSRLRVIVEPQPIDKDSEFTVTPLCRHMWDELNHPLEMFALEDDPDSATRDTQHEAAGGSPLFDRLWSVFHNSYANEASPVVENIAPKENIRKPAPIESPSLKIVSPVQSSSTRIVPFVFMVYKRTDYFKKAVESLLESDFPRKEVPLIVSHDGHFQDFVSYVETLKDDGFWVIQLFHPFACSEHPDTFPGEDPSLNANYNGDAYGNPRSAWVTCCKHHFTWLMKTVYALDLGTINADSFLFMEEDYVVAPTIYSAIDSGMQLIETSPNQPPNGFFGLVLDASDGFTKQYDPNGREYWFARRFVTGPMVMPRAIFERIRDAANEYCTFDDYNWDWSFVHLQGMGIIPHTALIPSRPQVLHIGFEGGMHEKGIKPNVRAAFERSKGIAPEFHATAIAGRVTVQSKSHMKGYGGWGHPADQKHCLELLAK